MYKHLLVPIDNSPLATSIIDQAVRFAVSSDAKLTFLHVRSDLLSTSDGALTEVLAPNDFEKAVLGNANGVLARAKVASLAENLEVDIVLEVSNDTKHAILNVAHDKKCDLIFIASHGYKGLKGLLHGSLTQKLLQETTIPVLVARVESNDDNNDMHRAISIIKNEHRSIAAVLSGLLKEADKVTNNKKDLNPTLVVKMLQYLVGFPQDFHHQKENDYIFAKLRKRTTVFNVFLEELEAQHIQGDVFLKEIKASFHKDLNEASPHISEASVGLLKQFAEMQWQHLKLEEKVIMPAACEHLLKEDWTEIRNAFESHLDPISGMNTEEDFEATFIELMNQNIDI